MSWKDALQTASYKGVPFKVQTMTSSGGHRLNVIDYPESVLHDIEDMGPKNGSFQFSGYVLGDNYFAEREALIKALEESSPGELVHSTRGRFIVKCADWSCNETADEQRIARFSFSFQIKDIVFILSNKNSQKTVYDKKETLLEKIAGWFRDAYDYAQKPVTAINNATDTIDKGLDVIRSFKQVTGSVSEFQSAITEAKGRVVALTLNADVLAQDMESLINYGTDPKNLAPIPLDTSADKQRQDSKNIQTAMKTQLVAGAQEPSPTIQHLIWLNAIAAETGLLASSEFDSPDLALAEEKDIIKRYDELLNIITPSPELYDAIRDLLASVHNDLKQRIIDLSRVATFTMTSQRNALELMSSIYKDLDEYNDFIKRNAIVHPGFINAEIPLRLKVVENG